VSPADAGNNFFFEGPSSIGKNRAEEAVRLLKELNDAVDGTADTRSLESVISSEEGKKWLKSFTLVIVHNLEKKQLLQLSAFLWEDEAAPPLLVIRSAGFIAEFYIQYHKHEGRLVFHLGSSVGVYHTDCFT
jgi:amyloid beta precursor protein binding protein 1